MKIRIVRSKNKKGFVMVSNITSQDNRLSFGSRGLLVYLLSLPDDWDLNLTNLTDDISEGRDKIRKYVKELEKFGYLHRQKRRSQGGQWVWAWEIHEVTKRLSFGIQPVPEKPYDGKPGPGKPYAGKPYDGKPGDGFSGDTSNTYNKNLLTKTKNKEISCLASETDHFSFNYLEDEKSKERQRKKREENKKFKSDATDLLNFLNEKTGKNFRPVETNLKLIIAILKTGATILSCRQVIVKKHREWSTTEMEEYLRPKTLFSKRNFEQYLGELVLPKD